MKALLVLPVLFILSFSQPDPIAPIHKELQRMDIYMSPPPDSYTDDTCYHYSELIRLVIDKHSKVVSIDVSDTAPGWLRMDIDRQKARNNFRFSKSDSMAQKAKLRNCTLVFPLILESIVFPCGNAPKKQILPAGYFKFGGKQLQGNIIFGEQLRFTWLTKFKVS